ncbi:MAG: thiamine ABC transporter substrate-binding protein [Acidimicrobiia bacterium]
MRRYLAVLLLAFAACGDDAVTPGGTITLMAHDSFVDAVTEATFADFTTGTGFKVEVLRAGDAGAMTNQAVLTKDNPLADVLFGIDDTFLTRGLEAGIFEPYESPSLDQVPAELQLDPEHRVTPIDYGDVCINYDKEAFTDLPPPETLEELIAPEYFDMLVVEHPATSSPGLAFLLATIDRFDEEGWQTYWQDLFDNGAVVAPGWSEAYYEEFSGGGGSEGTRPLVVSYASSPPAEVIFSETPLTEAPTGVVTDGCYRQVEFAGVLAGTGQAEAAQTLINFMLSVEFQETIPLTWFVFPANVNVELPEEFVAHTSSPIDPVQLAPELIETNRQRWLDEWAEIFG